MATAGLKRRLSRLEREIPPGDGADNVQWDLSELSDDELSYLEGIYAAGGTLEADPKALEICKKAKQPVESRQIG